MNNKFLVTIVIPCMNEEGNIFAIYERIQIQMKKYKFEILFVDDGSTDRTIDRIKELSLKYKNVNYLSFSRNFGHQKALKAGYDHAFGDCVICMDADLQHPPEVIPELIQKWQEGYEVVYTVRDDSVRTGFFKKITAKYFYSLLRLLSGVPIEDGAADFRLLDKKVISVIRENEEEFLFLRGYIFWAGFNRIAIKYVPEERFSGKTKYSFKKMFAFAISGITSFSINPLRLTTFIGLIIIIFTLFYSIYIAYVSFYLNLAVKGWSSTLLTILMLGGFQLLSLGIMGEYLGKMFLEVKKRPRYIITEKKLKKHE